MDVVNKRNKIAILLIVGALSVLVFSENAFAAMTSSNYQILWDTLSSGGDDTSASASYTLRDTIGGTVIGDQVSSSYDLRAGYRQGVIDQVISFSLFPQTTTSTTATSFAGSTINVASASSFAYGDYIVLVHFLIMARAQPLMARMIMFSS